MPTEGAPASLLVDLALGGFVLASLCAAAVATMVLVAWRYGRRRWRALRAHPVLLGAGALWAAIGSGHLGSRPPGSVADLADRPARTVRRELWRSVDRAEAAVRTAEQLGGATADLPSLSRRLRQAAVPLDRILRVEPGQPVSPAVASQAFDVIRAASDVQQAALSSAGDATRPRIDELTRDAEQELACLEGGLESTRRALGAPRT